MNAQVKKIRRPSEETVEVTSTLDGKPQRCRLVRAHEASEPRPLLVTLHSWSGDYTQNLQGYIDGAIVRNWHCILPDFRGPNWHPDACGSPKARQDIVDAVDWACANLKIDADRIYLAGGSGGGHMTLRMAGHAPRLFAAASAWCPISDLAAWYREHVKDGQVGKYAQDIVQSVGGVPGESDAVDEQVHDRSPVHHMHDAAGLPLDIAHGIFDGRKGSVPFWHSLWAFNRIAHAIGSPQVTQREIDQLWNDGRLENPLPEDTAVDDSYEGKAIYLRRHADKARVTIFEGAHVGMPEAACRFLEVHSKRGPLEREEQYMLDASDAAASGQTTIAG